MADNGAALSSSSSSSSLSEGMYDVFLSFRGEDTRYISSDSLYRKLAENGNLKVFRDCPGLKLSDPIKSTLVEAIKGSRMFIVMMSSNYVSSSWCLVELVEILKYSNNGRNRAVFPVFYHVEPSEVRYQNSVKSKEAMRKHEERYGKDTVAAWESALSTICGLCGQHIVKNKGYETEVIDKIAEQVLAKNREIKQLLNRFDSQFEAVESLLDLKSRNTLRMVGIYEEDAEIDKTTFTLELYYKIKHEFKEASFLLGVSKTLEESADGLKNLQKAILSDMGVEVSTVDCTSTGSSEIKRRLRHKRVLLVLNDVDSKMHLELLARSGDLFGPGSRIIITTEDKDLLDNYPVIDGVETKTYCIRECDEFEGNKSSNHIVKEEYVVGLKKDFNDVIKQLMEEDSRDGNIVSIVGMGGIGKTTLARKIYNSDEVKKLFACRAWATISKDCREKEVFKSLLNCLKSSTSKHEDSSSEEELMQKVRKCLTGKKYLIVLDDIWDTKAWATLKGCFPENNDGGMILITTRNDQVAYFLRSKKPHHKLSFMDKEESWKLFCNEVFCREKCPPKLERIGRSIANTCSGLPLAIKITAGFVAKTKRSGDEWKRIKKLLPHLRIVEDKECKKMKERLMLSYDDLPENIKPCFLYLGVFPEDDQICARDLIRLWITEGLIEEPIQSGRSKATPAELEDIGEQHLKELVDRNLVQVSQRRSDDKGVKTCQIHDLIRELCISESKNPDNNNNNARRLSFPKDIGSYAWVVTSYSKRLPSYCAIF
ncbi:disease resistance protein RPH8A-like [Arachis stenosperma]|uniref:disease resistance protein RPH8A-like n=1 Tax=Arachis stenosperma TaxID=217475 RepID=UPI0025AC9B66|nr:disease resistance protein RPH8A-like [Arachis stenosperma]